MASSDKTTDLIDSGIVTELNYITRTSAKSGKPYSAIEIVTKEGYRKLVFPEIPEAFMLDKLVSESAS